MFGIGKIYWVVINSFTSFLFLFIISKILGKKQIAQLEFIDYVVGISLGSIAADWSFSDNEIPFYYFAIAMAMYFLLALAVSYIGRKTPLLKRVFKGKPVTLIYQNKIIYKNLKKCKIDINDLLSMLREKGYFDINDVEFAIFETSGELSILPKGNQRPVVIEDLTSKNIQPATLTNTLIVDGEISKSGLDTIKKNKAWLFKKMKIKDKKELKNIILATFDHENNKIITHYKK